MKKLTDNQWRWIWVIALIILPSVLVRLIYGDFVRIISMTVLLGFFPAFLVIGGILVSGKKFFLKPEIFEERYGKKVLKWFVVSLKSIGVIAGVAILIWTTFPAYTGLYSYLILNKPLISVEGKIEDINTGIIDPIGLINQTVQLDNEQAKSYSLWYPSTRMHVGENYHFDILPNTNIILRSEKIGS